MTQPKLVDLHVGARIRLRRKLLGCSQNKLAADMGLTFQQIQKYERGVNRVSASKLHDISRCLKTSIGYFFEGLEQVDPDARALEAERSLLAFLTTPEGLELASLFPRVTQGRARRSILDLVRAMAEDHDAVS